MQQLQQGCLLLGLAELERHGTPVSGAGGAAGCSALPAKELAKQRQALPGAGPWRQLPNNQVTGREGAGKEGSGILEAPGFRLQLPSETSQAAGLRSQGDEEAEESRSQAEGLRGQEAWGTTCWCLRSLGQTGKIWLTAVSSPPWATAVHLTNLPALLRQDWGEDSVQAHVHSVQAGNGGGRGGHRRTPEEVGPKDTPTAGLSLRSQQHWGGRVMQEQWAHT